MTFRCVLRCVCFFLFVVALRFVSMFGFASLLRFVSIRFELRSVSRFVLFCYVGTLHLVLPFLRVAWLRFVVAFVSFRGNILIVASFGVGKPLCCAVLSVRCLVFLVFLS